MNCAQIRERILDLAIDEHIGEAALLAHLDSCAGCREALASRRALLAAMDRVLIEELREEPSPLLAARVRERIEKAADPHRAWWLGWIPPAAAGRKLAVGLPGVAFVVLVALFMRDRLPSRLEEDPVGTAASSTPVPTEPTLSLPGPQGHKGHPLSTVPSVTAAPVQAHHARSRPPRSNASLTTARGPAFPEVIVPAGEMTAVLRLSEAAARHPFDARALQGGEPVATDPFEPLTIEAIKIAPLTIVPLEEPVTPLKL